MFYILKCFVKLESRDTMMSISTQDRVQFLICFLKSKSFGILCLANQQIQLWAIFSGKILHGFEDWALNPDHFY